MSNEQRVSRMPKIYVPGPGGAGPLRWQDDVTGILPAAVRAFIDEGLGRAKCMSWQTELVRDYMEYYVYAPCWTTGDDDPDFRKKFLALRERVKSLKSAEEIAAWLNDALDLGLDPL